MKRFFSICILLLGLALFFSSCSDKKTGLSGQSIAKSWVVTEVVNLGENTTYAPDSLDHFKLINGDEATFKLGVKALDWDIEGNWTLKDSVLSLRVFDKDVISQVDSIVFSITNREKELVFFSDGKEQLRQKTGDWQVPSTIIDFRVKSFDDSHLSLVNDQYRINLSYINNIPAFSEHFGFLSILRGIGGLLLLVGIAWLFSSNRKAVSWKVVITGVVMQIILAIGILKVPFVQYIFNGISRFFVVILDFSNEGATFLLGGLLDTSSYGFIFAFQVLPTIIFFSALTSVLFYYGIIQKIVWALAWVMTKALKISGAESLSVAGNIFLGQTESPLLIKAYLEKMNRSEILLVMTGGMATLAGGVLAAYISFLGGDDPAMRLYFAKHLLAASIMAAPGAVVAAKILVPQTEPIDTKVEVTKDKIGSNILEAIANGTGEGLKLAANVAAMLLVFVALIAMVNFFLKDLVGVYTGLNPLIADLTNNQYSGLSLQFILGYVFAPLVWLLGVGSQDMALVGQVLGEKIIMSEFVAYISLADLKEAGSFFSEKSLVMATYMLCGFANFASIGIQIGGIGSLAPNQRTTLSQLGMKALIGGTIASLLSATIVGMLY